jgi:beta-galactosidase GanA
VASVRDSYRRVTWRELEPTQGNYDFSRIDEGIATARANGGVFGFRVQAACTGCAAGGVAVPDYLKDLMPKGFWFRLNNTTNYAPDWNDPDYLSRLDALLHALGERYGNDPRVGFVDISSYGDYGEWHVHQWPYPSATGDADHHLRMQRRSST